MKLLYKISSGNVVARYSEDIHVELDIFSLIDLSISSDVSELNTFPKSMGIPHSSDRNTPSEAPAGHALITVPDSVAVPHAIVRVVNGDVPQFIVDQEAIDIQWQCAKEKRNQQLTSSDWMFVISDYVHPKKEEWTAYRQALRDMTQQANPFALVWPQAPSGSA